MRNLLAGGFVALSLALGAGFVLGQETARLTPSQQAFVDVEKRAYNDGGASNYEALTSAYIKAPDNPEVISQMIKSGIIYRDKLSTVAELLAVQVAQNQKMIEQNAQILQDLKAKPR